MIVLDSSLLVAYHNSRDVHHDAATETVASIADGAWGRVLLLEYVRASGPRSGVAAGPQCVLGQPPENAAARDIGASPRFAAQRPLCP